MVQWGEYFLFKIVSATSAIDFVDKNYERVYAYSEITKLNETETGDIELKHQLALGTTQPVFIFLGLQFWQVNPSGTIHVANKKMDPVSIVNVIID